MARTYAGVLGAAAFVTVLLRGLLLGGGVEGTLQQACIGLVVFTLLGLLAGRIAESTVTESVQRRLNEELQQQKHHGEST